MTSPLTPEERSQRGRIAALIRWSQEDPLPNAQRANAGLMRKFLDQVDPERTLPVAERERRAEAAKKAHFARLAFLSAKARHRAGGDAA